MRLIAITRNVLLPALLGLVVACGPSPITRDNHQPCNNSTSLCRHNDREEAASGSGNVTYDLNFIDVLPTGEMADPSQLDDALRYINASTVSGQKTLVVVFVHGWFHSDDPTDRDVQRARKVLGWFNGQHPDWHVEGIYVGWMAWTSLPTPVKYATFWDRAKKADALGNGALKTIVRRVDDAMPPSDSTRLLFVGHSFGGRSLYIATSELFMTRLLEAKQKWDLNTKPSEPVRGVGDLVVLLEPALTADAFVPLFNAANEGYVDTYHGGGGRQGLYFYNDRPLFLSLTSDADGPVNFALPLSRAFMPKAPGTTTIVPWQWGITEAPHAVLSSDIGDQAFGRYDAVVTHRIEANGSVSKYCADTPTVLFGGFGKPPFNGLPLYQLPKGWLQCAVHHHAQVAKVETGAGYDELVTPDSCLQLRHLNRSSPYSPYWNARTHMDVIQGHSDFMNSSVIILFNQMLFSEKYRTDLPASDCAYADETPPSHLKAPVFPPGEQVRETSEETSQP